MNPMNPKNKILAEEGEEETVKVECMEQAKEKHTKSKGRSFISNQDVREWFTEIMKVL